MYRLLLLDDEPNVLAALERDLRQPDLFTIDKFTDAAEALEKAETRDYAVAIVDYRMPGADGIDFLERLIDLRPATARILLSGMEDKGILRGAINRAHTFYFITKPWEKSELVRVVATAIQQYARLKEVDDLKRVIKEQQAQINYQWQFLKSKNITDR